LHLSDPVGEPGPALVEHEHSSAGSKALDVSHEQRLLPRREQVARDAAYEDDVGMSVADYLIRDRDITAARVPNSGSCMAKVSPTAVSTAIASDS
jgi:hypothetical protein